MVKDGIPTELNATTFTEIKLGSDSAHGFDAFIDDPAIDWEMHTSSSGTGTTMPGEFKYHFPHQEEAGNTLMWAKSASGTPNLVILPHKFE